MGFRAALSITVGALTAVYLAAMYFHKKICTCLYYFEISDMKHSRIFLTIPCKETRQNQEKMLRSFWDISENWVFYKNLFSRKISSKFLYWIKFTFPIRNIPHFVVQTSLWGPETIRQKSRVVSEIFPKKSMFFWTHTFTHKTLLWGPRYNQEKILSIREISGKWICHAIRHGIGHAFGYALRHLLGLKNYDAS